MAPRTPSKIDSGVSSIERRVARLLRFGLLLAGLLLVFGQLITAFDKENSQGRSTFDKLALFANGTYIPLIVLVLVTGITEGIWAYIQRTNVEVRTRSTFRQGHEGGQTEQRAHVSPADREPATLVDDSMWRT